MLVCGNLGWALYTTIIIAYSNSMRNRAQLQAELIKRVPDFKRVSVDTGISEQTLARISGGADTRMSTAEALEAWINEHEEERA